MLIAGHYESVDERISGYIDEEISIGDYVLTGGELPLCIIIDSVVRLIPGVLKKNQATEEESFSEVSIDEIIDAVGLTNELDELKNSGKTHRCGFWSIHTILVRKNLKEIMFLIY